MRSTSQHSGLKTLLYCTHVYQMFLLETAGRWAQGPGREGGAAGGRHDPHAKGEINLFLFEGPVMAVVGSQTCNIN
jgi:hypothetical protein